MSKELQRSSMSAPDDIYFMYNKAVETRTVTVWEQLTECEKNLLVSAQKNDEAKETFKNYLLWLVFKFPGWYEASMEVMFQYITKKTNKFEINYKNANEKAPVLRKEFEGNRNGRFLTFISDKLFELLMNGNLNLLIEIFGYSNGIRGYVDNVLWNRWVKEYSTFERKTAQATPLDKWRKLLGGCGEQTLKGLNFPKYLPKLTPYEAWQMILPYNS